MKSVKEYRQEKYEKYGSLEEGKLFYRHEKNLDLVNTIEELVYILQEEDPWNDSLTEKTLKAKAWELPDSIKTPIRKKIHKIYENWERNQWRNEDSFIDKIIKKVINRSPDAKRFLHLQYPFIATETINELSDDIACISFGWIAVFFLNDHDWNIMVKYNVIKENTLWAFNQFLGYSVIFQRKGLDNKDSELLYNHEYQHYLFHNYLANKLSSDDINYKIIDEICAELTDPSCNDPDQTLRHMVHYIKGFCDVDDVVIDSKVSEWWKMLANVTVKKDGEKVNDIKQLKDVWTFLMLMPWYVEIAHLLINMFATFPQLNMDRNKAIYLLSITPPRHRTKLLRYYISLAEYTKKKL